MKTKATNTKLPEETMAQRLRKLRVEHDCSQENISDVLHVERDTYGKYEREKHEPSINVIITLADYYNVTTDYILTGKSNDRNEEISDMLKKYPPAKQRHIEGLFFHMLKMIEAE